MSKVHTSYTLGFKFHRQSLTMSGRIILIYLKGQNMTGIKTVGYKMYSRHSFTQDPSSPAYTTLQNKRMRRCGVVPPPIIFERLKLPQQIIYRRKENLSESPNHQKYWENILVSRFYKQFSRNRRNLGHFRKFEKVSNS